MIEEWKDIDGYEDLYEVSSFGNVRGKKRGCILKGCKSTQGYLVLNLCKKGKSITNRIHRLVAGAFLEKDKDTFVVNHLNGIKTDNRVSNLEWCSQSSNIKHSYDTGLSKKGVYYTRSKLNKDQVVEIRELLTDKIPHRSIAAKFGVSRTTITMINTGKIYKIN